jgi:PAS domain S-box-containing protein
MFPCFTRFLITAVVFILLFFLSAYPVLGKRTVRVAAEPNLPMASVNAKGEGEGLFMDIIRYVAHYEGWTVSYVSCDWDLCLEMLRNGEIDLLAAVALSEDRVVYADFTGNSIVSNWGQVYVVRGKTIDSFMQLEGKSIAVVKADTHNIALRDMLFRFGVTADFVEVGNYEQVFRALKAGRADAGVVNRFFGLLHEDIHDVRRTNLIFNPIELRFAAPKGKDPGLVATLDRYIETLKTDRNSPYYYSLRRWTGIAGRRDYPDWIKWVVLSVTGIACLIMLHNLMLRTRVKSRTARMEKEILERVRADEALRVEKDRGLALTENAPFGMVMIAGDGAYRYVNPKFTEIFGYTLNDVPDGRTWFRKAYPDRDYRHRVIGAWLAMVERFTPGENKAYENRVACSDGTEKIVSFTPVRLQGGEILITMEDITVRRVAENQLVGYREHLEELVAERTAELEIARQKAESADHLKSAFLATMSHELRTPLNSIIGFTGLLIQGLAGPLNEEQHKQLGMVQNSSRHLLDLINDVLDISKIEAGQLDIEAEPFDLMASVNKVVGLVSPLAERKGLALSLRTAGEMGTFVGDRRRVEQIIINLVNNSIKFTEKGFIEISCAARDTDVVLSVKDSGIGIDAGNLERIFNPFQQVDTGLSRRHEGTGLGLSITRKLVDMMGGQISVHSVIGEGSTFTVVLPARRKEEA